jgi:hypothetical protein
VVGFWGWFAWVVGHELPAACVRQKTVGYDLCRYSDWHKEIVRTGGPS